MTAPSTPHPRPADHGDAPYPGLLAHDRPPQLGAGWGVGGRGRPWIGIVAAGVWLVYLAPAAAHVVDGGWALGERIAAGGALVLFVVLYLSTLAVAVPARAARNARRAGRVVTWPARGDREMAARTAGLAVLALASALAFGNEWLPMVAFVAAVLAVVLDRRWAPRAIVGVAVVAELLLLVRGTDDDGSSYFWIGFAVLVAGFVTYATRRRNELVGELGVAREQNARLAVSDERERIARDLHDLLGHSLSVIAVKSQLAERLLERDEPERAAAEIRDVRGVAREALHEVRHVVDGYRRRPLAAELPSSAAALRSAGVQVATELPDHPVPQEVEDVLAFVVREGTTNVLRHGRAAHAVLAVRANHERVVATVADDGPGAVAPRTVAPPPDDTGILPVRPPGASATVHGPPASAAEAVPGSPVASDAGPSSAVPAAPVGSAPPWSPARAGGLEGLAGRLARVGGVLEIGPGDRGGTTLRATVPVAPGRGSAPQGTMPS